MILSRQVGYKQVDVSQHCPAQMGSRSLQPEALTLNNRVPFQLLLSFSRELN
jgi:hypothetical protein